MLLAIDVGNTNVVFGMFDGDNALPSFRLATDIKRTADEYGLLMKQMIEDAGIKIESIKAIIISSVVPSLFFTLEHMSLKTFNINPIVVTDSVDTGLAIDYDDPGALGADRIVNAVAAHSKYNGHLIVVDFGTATTFSCISKDAVFMGGAITPGIKTSALALFEHTAKLPNVDLEIPKSAIGHSPSWGMQSGLIFGHMGLSKYLIELLSKEMCEKLKCKPQDIHVVATGGMATMVESGIDCIDYIDRRLTLDGLNILYKRNQNLVQKRVLQD